MPIVFLLAVSYGDRGSRAFGSYNLKIPRGQLVPGCCVFFLPGRCRDGGRDCLGAAVCAFIDPGALVASIFRATRRLRTQRRSPVAFQADQRNRELNIDVVHVSHNKHSITPSFEIACCSVNRPFGRRTRARFPIDVAPVSRCRLMSAPLDGPCTRDGRELVRKYLAKRQAR